MQIHPPQVRKFLFCLSLDLGTKLIAGLSSLFFGFVLLTVTVDVFLHERYYLVTDVFSDITLTSFGIFSLVLLNGAFQINPVQMLPWVLINLVFLGFLAISFILSCTLLTVGYERSFRPLIVLASCITFVSYTTAVVYSRYLELKEEPSV